MLEAIRFTCDQADVAEPVRPVLIGKRYLVQALPDNTAAVALGGLHAPEIPDGMADDIPASCAAYERAIALGGHMDSAERNLRLLRGLPPEPEDAGRPGVPAGWAPVFPEP